MVVDHAVHAEGLVKNFGRVRALDGLNLHVDEGSLLALLGPNGAGKTTAVRIFTTLLKPDGGLARVAGFDVVKEPDRIKAHIGLAGQTVAIDEFMTGQENLEMSGPTGSRWSMPGGSSPRAPRTSSSSGSAVTGSRSRSPAMATLAAPRRWPAASCRAMSASTRISAACPGRRAMAPASWPAWCESSTPPASRSPTSNCTGRAWTTSSSP